MAGVGIVGGAVSLFGGGGDVAKAPAPASSADPAPDASAGPAPVASAGPAPDAALTDGVDISDADLLVALQVIDSRVAGIENEFNLGEGLEQEEVDFAELLKVAERVAAVEEAVNTSRGCLTCVFFVIENDWPVPEGGLQNAGLMRLFVLHAGDG